MSSDDNALCPLFANITLSIALPLSLVSVVLMRLFWKHRESPAFKCRRVNMTIAVSFCITLSMLFPNLAAYNVCHSRAKVISNNFYGRLKAHWTCWSKPWAMKLDDKGLTFRAIMITTHILITKQDPLKRGKLILH